MNEDSCVCRISVFLVNFRNGATCYPISPFFFKVAPLAAERGVISAALAAVTRANFVGSAKGKVRSIRRKKTRASSYRTCRW